MGLPRGSGRARVPALQVPALLSLAVARQVACHSGAAAKEGECGALGQDWVRLWCPAASLPEGGTTGGRTLRLLWVSRRSGWLLGLFG